MTSVNSSRKTNQSVNIDAYNLVIIESAELRGDDFEEVLEHILGLGRLESVNMDICSLS